MKMMNFMTIFMAWMFYWIPAGLCVYFIVSGAWGIMERKLLPKLSHDKQNPDAAATATATPRPRRPSIDGSRNGKGVFGKVAEWWQEILKKADKK
jgi:YidC/Oxa1 family membrane protein insertase